MIKPDRTGTFRVKLLEHAINKTKVKEDSSGGYPQLIASVAFTEFYDAKEGQWFPIEDWDMGAIAYCCLYGFIKKEQQVGKTLTCEQVMKVFSWDGGSLAELAKGDYSELEFQVRVEENTYEGAKSPFQISWIDEYDADPVYTLRKLDAKEIKDLDAQFSNVTASAKKAASAKKPKAHPARVSADDKSKKPLSKKAQMKAKSDRIKKQEAERVKQATAAKTAAPKAPTAPAPAEESGELPLPEVGEPLTMDQAYDAVQEMKDPGIDDGTIDDLWLAALQEVTGEEVVNTKTVTGEQWSQVKDIVLADCGKF